MAEPPKEFPQTGADGHGQVSPQLGENWLPHDNAVIPAGSAPAFATPAYEGESIIDFHPPTRIPDHPFKVNRYYSKREGKHIIRIRTGRFYLTTNVTKAVQAGSGGVTYDFMAVAGDDGFPSFANDSAAGATGPGGVIPKEFSDSDMAGYAFMDYPDVTEDAYVYVRYILKHNTNSKIGFAGISNDLNIVYIYRVIDGELFIATFTLKLPLPILPNWSSNLAEPVIVEPCNIPDALTLSLSDKPPAADDVIN